MVNIILLIEAVQCPPALKRAQLVRTRRKSGMIANAALRNVFVSEHGGIAIGQASELCVAGACRGFHHIASRVSHWFSVASIARVGRGRLTV